MKKIFEKVNLVVPLEQRRFFNYFEDTVGELKAMYRKFVLKNNDAEYIAPTSLEEKCPVLPLYTEAIVDNIIFLAGQGQEANYKSEFMRKAREAYLAYWTEDAKGRRIRKVNW